MSGPHLHFYATENNDVLVRTQWFQRIIELRKCGKDETEILAAIDNFLREIPGGISKYSLWSNVKCPHCGSEFSYRFRGDLGLRLDDMSVILIDGCRLDIDGEIFAINVDAIG
ncbi:hypothetical protein RO07_12375 [Pandoraea pulmonicola]|jgi:hypothetical protein|uniref:Uncharacterized protein n=1 Tax=Pandoraea pulmonicola TaxID=93221 RepID=A0AAJ5D060_PANPU|nr:hypothetical protein RO07_12375 [Pandoraea pulmonicola]SUA90292.1 Uncharacterised protein [Pandoraea pulmonicola]